MRYVEVTDGSDDDDDGESNANPCDMWKWRGEEAGGADGGDDDDEDEEQAGCLDPCCIRTYQLGYEGYHSHVAVVERKLTDIHTKTSNRCRDIGD